MKIESLRWIVPLLGIAVASSAYGQKGDHKAGSKGGNNRIVVYDFASKQDGIVKSGQTIDQGVSVDSGLNDHESFTVKILNINTSRYTIKVAVSPTNFFTTMPSQFKPFVPAAAGAGAAGDATGHNLTDATVEQKKVNAAQQVESTIEQIATDAQTQMAAVTTPDEARAVAASVRLKVRTLLGKVVQLPEANADDISKAFNENLNMFKPSGTAQARASSMSDSDLVGALNQLAKSAVDLAGSVTKNTNPDADAQRATLASPDASEAMRKAISTIQLALSGDYMSSYSGTFVAIGDETDITITITDTQSTPAATLDPVVIPIPTNGGFKTDFSGGLMLTGLVDASYRSVANPNGNGTFLAQTRSGNNSRTTNVFFAHTYYRSSGRMRDINFGLSLGVSVDQTPVYAAGISCLIGRSQRLCITFGEAFGTVTRVDGPGPYTSATIPTTTVFMGRPFVALSYNF